MGDDKGDLETDKLLSFTALIIRESFPGIRIILILNSEYKLIIQSDPQYNSIEIFCTRQMNEIIMACSLENTGYSTTL